MKTDSLSETDMKELPLVALLAFAERTIDRALPLYPCHQGRLPGLPENIESAYGWASNLVHLLYQTVRAGRVTSGDQRHAAFIRDEVRSLRFGVPDWATALTVALAFGDIYRYESRGPWILSRKDRVGSRTCRCGGI